MENPSLLKVEHLGDSDAYIAFFENENDEFGIATLKEGANQKLRIRGSSYGDSDYYYYGISTNNGSYGIVTARNLDKGIFSINVNIYDDPFEYTVSVPKEPIFMITKKLPKGTSSDKYADIYFFDKNHNEIK